MRRSHRVAGVAGKLSSAMALAACLGLLSFSVAGCVAAARPGGGAAASGSSVPEEEASVPPVRDFAPTTPAATHYNAPPAPAPQTSLGTAMAAAIAATPRLPGVHLPLADARLFHVCQELAQLVPEEGIIPYPVVEFVMHRHGIVEPSPHLLVVWGALDDDQEIVKQLQPRLEGMLARAPARFGIGAARRARDGSGAVVFALQSSGVFTTAIPRSLPAEGRVRLEARLAAPHRSPRVLMLQDDGRVRELPITGGEPLSVEISCAGRRGRQQIEIAAMAGPKSAVLANFPLWCGEVPPSGLRIPEPAELLPITSSGEVEQKLFELINLDRLALGMPALLWDEPVAAVGRAYSSEMRATQDISSHSYLSGSAITRLRAAGISRGVVLQNVARAYGIEESHAGLMTLPSTRESAISPQATHIGIGVVLGENVSGRPELFITQVITGARPAIDPRAVAVAVHARLSAGRSLPRAAALDQIAQAVAEDLARGKSRETAWQRSSAAVKTILAHYSKVESAVTAYADASSNDLGELLQEIGDEVGIGIAQGDHPQLGQGATWVVLLTGHRKK